MSFSSFFSLSAGSNVYFFRNRRISLFFYCFFLLYSKTKTNSKKKIFQDRSTFGTYLGRRYKVHYAMIACMNECTTLWCMHVHTMYNIMMYACTFGTHQCIQLSNIKKKNLNMWEVRRIKMLCIYMHKMCTRVPRCDYLILDVQYPGRRYLLLF